MGQALELDHEGHAVERAGRQHRRRAEQRPGLRVPERERGRRERGDREAQKHHMGGVGFAQGELSQGKAQPPEGACGEKSEKGEALHGALRALLRR